MTEINFQELAEHFREQGKPVVALAVEKCLEESLAAAKAAHDTRQEIVRQRSYIADLEQRLGMVKAIRYQDFRVMLPEGGQVTLRFPDSMTSASADMIREMVDIQMKFHARKWHPQESPPPRPDVGEAREQVLEDESDGSWAAFELSHHAQMSDKMDRWPVWLDAWYAAMLAPQSSEKEDQVIAAKQQGD